MLVTIRVGPLPAIEELINDIAAEKCIVWVIWFSSFILIIDDLTDLRIQAETEKQLTRIRPKRIVFGVTVGGFRSSSLQSLQGWDESVLAEDTDLTFRVYLAGYKTP